METINQQLANALERIKELEKACFCFDLSYHAMEKELKKADEKIKELEADNEALKHAALCHCDENDKLNKQLEDAENTYYAIKGKLDYANKRIKELEANEQAMNGAHCKLMDKLEAAKPKWISFEDKVPTLYQNILVNVPGANKENRMEPTRSIFWCPAREDELKHGMLYYTHWMQLPPPPTEESTETEKEDK